MPTARRLFLGGSLTCLLAHFGDNPQALAAPLGETELRSTEAELLHTKLDLGGVRRYVKDSRSWRPFQQYRAKLLVVHLWAVECTPCVEEMPMLRAMVRAWDDEPAVRFLIVAETLNENKLLEFWLSTAKDRVPAADLLQSTDSRIRDTVAIGTQPLTLLLDPELIIRQAFIGSLSARKFEFSRAIKRLASGLNMRK